MTTTQFKQTKEPGEAMPPPNPAGIRPLQQFALELGKSSVTLWSWRKRGWLQVLNICGKNYITDEAIARFKARALAGEFAKRPVVPRKEKQSA
jgi:hypothetical protein